jgi:hypothetical protein
MPPVPKHPSARSRRNKTPGARTLTPVDPKTVKVPDLPKLREWHPQTLLKWKAVHESPMFPEYDQSDIEGLIALAILWDDFWKAEDPTPRVRLMAEIRMNEVRYGLSPIDRRRLAWEIDRGEQAEKQTQERRNRDAVRAAEARENPEADPREMLGG